MRKLFFLTAFLGASLLGLARNNQPDSLFEPGKIYLKLRLGSPALPEFSSAKPLDPAWQRHPQLLQVLQQVQASRMRNAALIPDPVLRTYYEITFARTEKTAWLMAELEKLPNVELAERKPLMRKFQTPNDVHPNQYHLGTINAAGAWGVTLGSPTVVVAIVDDAVYLNHTDLGGNAWVNTGEIPGNSIDDDGNGFVDDINGYDVSDNDNNPNPPNGILSHGTHCAGIAAAVTNNNTGIASVSYNVRLMGVKATPNSSTGTTINDAYDGVQYAIAAGADVISMSWGGGGYSSFGQNVMNSANAAGIVLVAAAGNDGVSTVFYPAGYTNVIAVAASTSNDQLASFSNFGSWIDVTAPGVNIWSTLADNPTDYGFASGTSMACPLVAGLVGLMLSANPLQTPAQIETCLENGCDNINAQNPTKVGQMGAGRINAFNAVSCVPPVVTNNNALVAFYASPGKFTCSNSVAAQVVVANDGNNNLTSLKLRYSYDLGPYDTITWSGNLAKGQSDTLLLPAKVLQPGQHRLICQTLLPNNVADDALYNDTLTTFFTSFPPPTPLPFTENFESNSFATNNWVIDNPDVNKTWEIVSTGSSNPSGGSRSARVNLYFYTNSEGQRDGLISRPISLANISNPSLSFKHAYRRYSTSREDSLLVYVSTDCGASFQRIFTGGGGSGFATGTVIGQTNFVPAAGSEWCGPQNGSGQSCFSLSLSPYVGQNVLLKFETYSDYGNNIYIDDINVFGTPQAGLPAFTSNTTVACAGSTVQFQDLSNQTGAPVFQWLFPGGTPATSTAANPSITYSSAGSYAVSLIVNTDTLTIPNYITVLSGTANLNILAPDSVICNGETAQLTASGGQSSSFTWSPGTAIVGSTVGNVVTAQPIVTTTYTLTGVASNGCQGSVTKTIVVQDMTPDFGLSPNPLDLTSTDGFCQMTDLTTPNATSWLWNSGIGATSFVQNPKFKYLSPGTYTVSLQVKNAVCTRNISKQLVVTQLTASLHDALNPGFAAWPNPAHQRLNVQLPTGGQMANLRLLNSLGQVVLQHQASLQGQELELNLETLPRGVYYLELNGPAGRQSLPIVRD